MLTSTFARFLFNWHMLLLIIKINISEPQISIWLVYGPHVRKDLETPCLSARLTPKYGVTNPSQFRMRARGENSFAFPPNFSNLGPSGHSLQKVTFIRKVAACDELGNRAQNSMTMCTEFNKCPNSERVRALISQFVKVVQRYM